MTQQEASVTDFYGREEAEQLKDYIESYYAIKVPPPLKYNKEDLSFWKIAGFETISFFVPSVAFAIFSAVRTSGFFFIQEQSLLSKYNLPQEFVWFLSLVVMIMGIMGFEGILLARGVKAGRAQEENKESAASTYLSVSVIIGIGIYIGLSMLPIPDSVMIYIDVLMALLTGIGGGVITFYGGNDIGYALKKYDLEKLKIQKEYQDNYDKWYEKAVQSYISTKKQVSKVVGVSNSSKQSSDTTSQQSNKKMSKSEQAYEFVKRYCLENDNLPTNKIVSESTGLALGTAFSAIESFVFDNAEELISKGLVSQEKVDKIRKTKRPNNISVSEWIENWIVQNNKFPEKQDIDSAGISMLDVAKWVVDNQDRLRNSSLLDEESIQGAIKAVRG